jgi:predicted anti-sigma-YlaC factor YlaD
MAEAEMSCRELVELVTDYLEGAMNPSERIRLEEHLQICRGCRAYLDQMQQTIQAVGHLPEDSVTPSAQDELLKVFKAWKASGPNGPAEAP